ncbi:unnamed protein product [Brachionus calyciflorus]|uniref:Uncharacterized protein n=1 Tax=Brachionus calyciflorus TaxID=104777 RepID=A0A813MZ83_9BILA|nr:unnamed protein product [Brachionus calyciflorus]
MDDEVITWNLRGPKRMKKRKELNALIKNNLKYKSVKKNSTADSFNMSSSLGMGGASGRLLNNYSSSEEQEYFFTANKTAIRQRRKRYYCRLFQLILIGFLISVCLLIGITMLLSYSKFQNLLNDLKKEVNVQKENTQENLNSFKLKLDEYDSLLKDIKDKLDMGQISQKNSNNKESRNIGKRSLKFLDKEDAVNKILNSVKLVDRKTNLNRYLIENLHFSPREYPSNLRNYLKLKNEKTISDHIKDYFDNYEIQE